ncbi:MAG: hypothetical protein N3E37_05040 [Candidatus Micrarchaeota archaeon]|nr:hypothetical protein [Candidatus Micrarchaeota archaeon]
MEIQFNNKILTSCGYVTPYYNQKILSKVGLEICNKLLKKVSSDKNVKYKLSWIAKDKSTAFHEVEINFGYVIDKELSIVRDCYARIPRANKRVSLGVHYKRECIVNKKSIEEKLRDLANEIFEKIVNPLEFKLVEIFMKGLTDDTAQVLIKVFPFNTYCIKNNKLEEAHDL